MGWRRRFFAPPWRRWHRRHHSGGGDATPPVIVPPTPIPGTLGLKSATFTTPDDVGTYSVDVIRTGGADGSVGISYSTVQQTALPYWDYTPVMGTLAWGAGDASILRIPIPIRRTLQTGNVTFQVVLSSVTGGATTGILVGTITIVRNPNGILGFTPGSWAVQDPGGGTTSITVTVERSGGLKGIVGVSWATADGTAIAGLDYTAASGILSWADADGAAKSIVVTILGRVGNQGSRTFSVSLSLPTGGSQIGASSATVTIQETVPGTNPSPGAHPPQQLIDPLVYIESVQLMEDKIGQGRDDILFNSTYVQKIGSVIGGTDGDLSNSDSGFGPTMKQRFQAYIFVG